MALIGLFVVIALSLAEEKPRRGGVLTWLEYADPARLDLHSESPLSVLQAVAGVYSGLLQYGPDDLDQWGPDLAERWEVSADGLEYTFHLRQGVTWHDGQPFTAADVKASLDRITNPDFRSPRCGTMIKPWYRTIQVQTLRAGRYHRVGTQ